MAVAFDPVLIASAHSRVAHEHGSELLVRAYRGLSSADRAAMLIALGDNALAGACAGGAFAALAQGDVNGALDRARAERAMPAARVLEAEALFAMGAIRLALDVLRAAHQLGYAPATLALARRTLQLGDNRAAFDVARVLPMHAHAVLVRARAAVALGRHRAAWRALEPYLVGTQHAPEASTAASIAVLASGVLSRLGERGALESFAERLAGAHDLVDTMMPGAARVAWTAGLDELAERRFATLQSPFAAAARLELALLNADVERARAEAHAAGVVGAPSAPALDWLSGSHRIDGRAGELFDRHDLAVHLWCTDAPRYAPWIDALSAKSCQLRLFDLSKGELPEPAEAAGSLLDDASLPGVVAPLARSTPERGAASAPDALWIAPVLCERTRIDARFPSECVAALRERFPIADSPEHARFALIGARDAAAHLERAQTLCRARRARRSLLERTLPRATLGVAPRGSLLCA